MAERRLPPAEFNPTVYYRETFGGVLVRVECWGREVARVWFDPASNVRRDWAKVAHRWANMVVSREYRRWRDGGEDGRHGAAAGGAPAE